MTIPPPDFSTYSPDTPTIELGPPKSRYSIYDPGGNGRVAKTLRRGIPYEKDVVEDMTSFSPTGLAVDVGANIGNHSLWLARVCGLTVHAFEPVKFNKLRANIALNDLEAKIRPHPHALGSRPSSAHLIGKNRLETGSGEFKVRPLDKYAFHDVSILKIDVEGMEEEVLLGAVRTIITSRPVVYAEAWDDAYLSRIENILAPLNYELTRKFRWNQHRWTPK